MVFFVLNWNRELSAFLSYQALLKLALKRKEKNTHVNHFQLQTSPKKWCLVLNWCLRALWYYCSLATIEIDRKKQRKKLFNLICVNYLRDNFRYKRFLVVLTRCCVRITRCLRKTLHFSKKATVQPSILIHCLSCETVGSKDFNNCEKINKYRRTFLRILEL